MKTNLTHFFRRMLLSVLAVVMLGFLSLTSNAQTVVTVGTGTVTNTTTSYPAPYGNYFKGAKHQFLFLASELQALGMPSGSIGSISFDVVTASGNPLVDLTIKMGTTASANLIGWETNLTTVYSTLSYTDVSGWNTHTFTTPFLWDGVSNIVVETCFDNGASSTYTTNAVFNQTSTSFVSSFWYNSDAGGVCPSTTSSSSNSQRPNVKFSITPPAVDAGIAAINSPVPPIGPGTHNVIATLRNFGSTTLTSATINWSVNGVTKTPYSWTGSVTEGTNSSPITLGTHAFVNGNADLKVWTSSLNAGTDLLSANDTFSNVYLVSAPLSGTYTIGGATADYATIGDALTDLNSAGVGGAVTFNINAGTYNEQLTFVEVLGASATNTITFQSTTADASTVIWQNAGTSANNFTMKLNGADYFRFKNITFKNTDPTYGRVIDLTAGASYNIFESNIIISGGASSSTTSCIYDGTTLNHYNTYLNNYMEGGYYTMYIYGISTSSYQKGTVIQGNEIVGSYYYPMNIYYQDSVQIIGNKIHSGVSTYSYGLSCYYPMNQYRILNNEITIVGSSSTALYGLRDYYGNYYSYNANPTGYGIVANNMVNLIGGTGANYGLYAYYSQGTEYYYNTVNVTGNSTTGRALYQYNTTSNPLGQTFKNNIFVNTGGGYAAYYGTTASVTATDYNAYYATGTNVGYWGANKATLADMQTSSSMDANSVSSPISFISATDLHNTTIATYQTGTPIASVTDDIDGELRNATTPSMGADEYVLYSNDAGVIAMTEPIAACAGVSTVKVNIKNIGIQSFTGVTVNWSVNGVPQTPYSHTSSMAIGAVEEVTLGTYTFQNNVIYNMVFYTSNPNSTADQNNSNDTLKINGFQTSLSGNYTIGATGDFATIGAAVNALNSFGVCGPVVFNIAAGTYTENLVLNAIVGASSTNTITFKSAANDKSTVSINYSAVGTGDNYVVKMNGVSYVSFKHITFQATGATYGRVFEFSNGTTNDLISNCDILTSLSTSSNHTPIYYISGMATNNITIDSNMISGGYYGIYWYGTSTAKHNNFRLTNNTIKDYYYYGLYSYYTDSMIIDNNTFTNASNSGTVYGIYSYYPNALGSISYNKISNVGTSTVYGIAILSKASTPAEVMTVANNVVNSTSAAASTIYGIYLSSSYDIDLYHNTSNVMGANTTTSRALYQTSGGNINIKNNIFANNGGGYAYYINTAAAILSSDYNDYYSSGTNFAYWGAARADLTALQTANSMDLASTSVNPVFANAPMNNLTPLNIAVDNLGANLGILTDAFGAPRSLTTPDMGAIEFTGLSADMALINTSIKNGYCLSTTDSIFVKVANVIGSTVDFSVNPLVIKWNVTGPVNSSDSIVVSTGTLASAMDSIFVGSTVNLSIPGTYTLSTYIKSNAVNTFGGNDTLLNFQVLEVMDPYYVTPAFSTVNNGTSTVELSVRSKYLPGGDFFISEICQFKGAVSGWPAYMGSDDYIEITGVPNSDIGGYTLEQWTTTLQSTYTFPAGTVMSPNGTAIFAVGEMGSSVPSPSNYYYHANGSYTGTWSSSTTSGRIIKDASGNIVDAVGYNGFTFPAAANVSSADWSSPLSGGSSTAGIRLIGADDNTGTNWVVSSTTYPQDPNTANTGVTVPSPGTLTGFSWSTNGVVTSVNSVDTIVGPYTTSGIYTYVANYSTTCGMQTDTAIVKVFVPAPLVVTNDTDICAGSSVDLSVTLNGTSPWTIVGTDGATVDTITNITTNPFIFTVNPADTTTYTVLEFWDAMNIPAPSNVSVTVNVKPIPMVSIDTVADLCESATAVALVGSPVGGIFSGLGVINNTFDPAVAGDGPRVISYSVAGTNGCIGTANYTVNVLGTPAISAGLDQSICLGDTATLEVVGKVKDPFFSEYQEGSSNHKIVEIFNGTGATINLDNYAILTNANGSAWSGLYTFPVGATLAHGDVFVIANNAADSSLLAVADEALAYNDKGYMMAYNGDDVRALVKFAPNGDTIIVDLIGLYNFVDPGTGWAVAGVANATVNHTMVRKPNAGPNYGDFAASQGTDSLTSDWLVYPQNTWTFAGAHTFDAPAVPASYTYLWSNTAATVSTTVMPLATSTYNVTVTNPATTCFAVDSVTVTVNALPIVNLGNAFDLCENDMTTLDAGAGFVGYLWSNMATTQSIDFYGYDLGVGTTTVYAGVLDSNGCANVDSVDVTVLAAPVVNLGADFSMKWKAGVDTLDAGAGFSSYLWSNNWTAQTLIISEATNQIGVNTYWVEVTDANSCTGSDTIIITVIDDTGLKGAIDLISVNIYPNPATDNVFVSMNGYNGTVQMEIVDLTGKVIYAENVEVNANFVKSLDVNTLATGVYYIKLTTDKHSQMHKLVVK